MWFWVVRIQRAVAKEEVGKEPWRGVRLRGERRMFSGFEVVVDVEGGMGELIATCVTPMAVATCGQMDDRTDACDARTFQGVEESTLGGRRSRGG
jgi:hypothetical protein